MNGAVPIDRAAGEHQAKNIKKRQGRKEIHFETVRSAGVANNTSSDWDTAMMPAPTDTLSKGAKALDTEPRKNHVKERMRCVLGSARTR